MLNLLKMVETKRQVRRRKTPWLIGSLMVLSLALLIVLQSTNLWKSFSIESSADLISLYALSSLNFIAFVIFGLPAVWQMLVSMHAGG